MTLEHTARKVRPLNQEVDRWIRAMRVCGVTEDMIDRVVLKWFEWALERPLDD